MVEPVPAQEGFLAYPFASVPGKKVRSNAPNSEFNGALARLPRRLNALS
jgi:hypothetical protein